MGAIAVWQICESPGIIPDVRLMATPSAAPGRPIEVVVEPGQSPGEIGEMLQELGVIDSDIQFRILVALLGYERMLQAGDYEFDPGMSVLEVVYRIRRGLISTRSITVVEGWRLEQIADALAEEGIPRQEFLLAAARAGEYDFDFLRELDPDQSLEGYLFPASYSFRRRDTARDIIQQMLQTFDEKVSQALRQEAVEAGLTLHDVLIIASIVEREALLDEERPIIAQVFLKRLRQGMPLEADPTVQYSLAQDSANVAIYGYWKPELTLEDLQVDSPYNTYQVPDLPPGPIANPSLESITAVIRPAETNYLFFVAKPDGSHAFAETLQGHLENVRRYQGQ